MRGIYYTIFNKLISHPSVSKHPKMRLNPLYQYQLYSQRSVIDQFQNLPHKRETEVKYLYNYWENIFRILNVSEPKESILNILASVKNIKNFSDIYKNFTTKLTETEVDKVKKMCELRVKGMPVQYVIGEWQFRDLVLKMEPPVFIPRPETEELVEIVLRELQKDKKYEVLEVCCGTGAISLALLKANSNIKVTAIDQSIRACQLTSKNAGMHQLDKRLTVRQYQVTDENRLHELDNKKYDIIVSNPPYVPSAEVSKVQPEIKLYEDLKALDGGPDGLSIIKPILSLASENLLPKGLLYLEVNPTHPKKIDKICYKQPELQLKYLHTYKDFCKKKRFVKLQRK